MSTILMISIAAAIIAAAATVAYLLSKGGHNKDSYSNLVNRH